MSAEWFVRQNDTVHGPFDAATLRRFAASNKIGLNTPIARSADGPWHPASKVKGLFPSLSAQQAFTAPPPPTKVQPVTPLAAPPTSPPPTPSVPASHQKGYAAQTLEPGEAIAFKTHLSSVVRIGPLLLLLLAVPFLFMGWVSVIPEMNLQPGDRQVAQYMGLAGGILGTLSLCLFVDALGKSLLNEYVVTNRRVVIRTGLFIRKIEEFMLPSVDSVVVEQGVGGQAAKYGTLVLTVGGNKLRHKYVVNPFEFCRVVKEQKPKQSAWA